MSVGMKSSRLCIVTVRGVIKLKLCFSFCPPIELQDRIDTFFSIKVADSFEILLCECCACISVVFHPGVIYRKKGT